MGDPVEMEKPVTHLKDKVVPEPVRLLPTAWAPSAGLSESGAGEGGYFDGDVCMEQDFGMVAGCMVLRHP